MTTIQSTSSKAQIIAGRRRMDLSILPPCPWLQRNMPPTSRVILGGGANIGDKKIKG